MSRANLCLNNINVQYTNSIASKPTDNISQVFSSMANTINGKHDTDSSLRDQLTGSWELIKYYAYLPSDPSDVYYPMGPEATGIIMYTNDGYMSAQLCTPGQQPFAVHQATESDWIDVGKKYVSYTGAFYLDPVGDEKGPVLYHQMRYSNWPNLRDDVQRRLMKITDEEDGRYLTLAPAGPLKIAPDGLDRILVVRWRRLPDTRDAKGPPVANKL